MICPKYSTLVAANMHFSSPKINLSRLATPCHTYETPLSSNQRLNFHDAFSF